MSRVTDADRLEAIKNLRKRIRPGMTVYTVLRHVSRTGMTRGIDVYLVKKSTHVWITGYVGKAIGCPQSMKDWQQSKVLRISGCGSDMGFEVVYNLGRVLFPQGFVPEKAKKHGRNGTPDTELDTDGGYSLNHKWL